MTGTSAVVAHQLAVISAAVNQEETLVKRVDLSLAITVCATLSVLWLAACSQSDLTEPIDVSALSGQIAFVSDRGASFDIYLMNADGTDLRTPSETPDLDEWDPALSPDGQWIAYWQGESRSEDLFLISVDGSSSRALTAVIPTDRHPAWSPDGSEIVFSRASNSIEGICIIATDPSVTGVTCITGSPFDTEPNWSPDGTKIVFQSSRTGDIDIWVVNVDGSGLTQLTENAGFNISPVWSPDGTMIAFASSRSGDFEIYVMNADGTGVTQLTDHVGIDDHPSWSPDGTMIAFESTRDGNHEIYVMNADGTRVTRITDHPAIDGAPSWSP